MRIIIVTENIRTIPDFNQVVQDYAHLYTFHLATNVDDFLEREDMNRFDLIFLEGKNKLSGVEKIKEKLPQANIILLNNGAEVIEEANVVNVIDIVDTPLAQADLIKVCQEAEYTVQNYPSENVVITGFNSLVFKRMINSKIPIDINWRTTRAKELFCHLLLNSNEYESKKRIQELFWEGFSEKKVTQQLYSTVYEIRKTLEKHKIPLEIVNSADKYMLKNVNAWIDFEVFEEQLNQIDEVDDSNVDRVKNILELYTGHLFEEEDYKSAHNKQEKLRFTWIIYMDQVSNYYVEKGKINEAIMHNLKMLEISPNNKIVKNNLDELYEEIGEKRI